jgi:crotonobetaine/carnitine-CoA ligase
MLSVVIERAFPSTVPGLLTRLVARAPDRSWLFYEGDSWTAADVADQVERAATGLAERGVNHGDRVAVMLGNRPETIFAWFAANRLGAVFVPINHALKRPEIAGALRLTRPKVVIASEHRPLVASAIDELDAALRPLLVSPGELALAGRGAPPVEVRPEDVAVLLSTSGTTGAPKAVAQSHSTYALTAEAFPFWLGLDESDRLLAALPFFHINAQAYSTMGALGAGAGLAILPKFSAQTFWPDARRLGATQFNGVGAMINILLRTEPRPSDREHSIRVCYAALALPEREHVGFEARFGTSLTVGYGMSETTFGTVWPRGVPPRYGTMGTLRQHPRLGEINRARVVRDDGSDAETNAPGELWLQNPAAMSGYWEDAAATAVALSGGWLRTGDLVRRDADGFFTFVARKKDVIRRRGENVAAAEIENVLAMHPSVQEAAAIGVPSDLGEDEIVAFVVARAGTVIDPEALRAWTREHLADFKVPKEIHALGALPRTETARVAKHLLKERITR